MRAVARLQKIHALCLDQPRAISGMLYGVPVFTIGRGKVFLWLLDGRAQRDDIAIAVRVVSLDEQEMLLEADADTFFKPRYLGRWRWIGLRLDEDEVDWRQIRDRVLASWFLSATVAQRRLAGRLE